MKLKLLRISIIALSFLSVSSCSLIFGSLYGVKNLKYISDEKIARYAKKYNIPLNNVFELDTSYYAFLVSSKTDSNRLQVKNHYQPLQALYFHKSGELRSFQINCYAGGFPNLEWDRDSIMTTFPPKEQAPVDNLLSREQQLSFLRPLSQTETFKVEDYDYLVVVYWSRYMGRQSKRLIRFVQENSKLADQLKVKIIYANADNFGKRLG